MVTSSCAHFTSDNAPGRGVQPPFGNTTAAQYLKSARNQFYHEAPIGKEAELIDVEHFALRSEPPLHKLITICLQELHQLLPLAQHRVRRRNIVREHDTVAHDVILSKQQCCRHVRSRSFERPMQRPMQHQAR